MDFPFGMEPRVSYEEVRDAVVGVLARGGPAAVDNFSDLAEYASRTLTAGLNLPSSPHTGIAYMGSVAQLRPSESDLILEVVWDLFRQGYITLGSGINHPGWPNLRLSAFGRRAMAERADSRFHDTRGYLALIRSAVPDALEVTLTYAQEASEAFYAGCMLASVVMIGVAAEAEFLRLIEIAVKNPQHGTAFSAADRATTIRQKIVKFQSALEPIRPTLQPKRDFEDLETNLSMIQSLLRVSRNEAGHPSGARAPTREQVYVDLQMFVQFAKQLMKLRLALA